MSHLIGRSNVSWRDIRIERGSISICFGGDFDMNLLQSLGSVMTDKWSYYFDLLYLPNMESYFISLDCKQHAFYLNSLLYQSVSYCFIISVKSSRVL